VLISSMWVIFDHHIMPDLLDRRCA